MLKKIRVAFSILFFILITFYFLDFREAMPHGFTWLTKIQLVPAILAGSLIIVVTLLMLTLFFGRIYCSSICPLGIFQDIAAWLSKRTAGRKKRYKFSKGKTILRLIVPAIIVILFLVKIPLALGLTDPYSAYGRMITNVFKPVYIGGNNILASIFSRFDNYSLYKVDTGILSIFSFSIGILTFLIIGFLAWRHGRTYCNTICPVGTVLGYLSKFSLYKIRIDDNKCNSCGSCARYCKASCIDSKSHSIDYSRCVDCFNCLGSCKQNALSFSLPPKGEPATDKNQNPDTAKRQFLLTGAATALSIPAIYAQDKPNQLSGTKVYKRQTPISPPGAGSNNHLLQHCTSCHLCVSRCPSKVIKPAFLEYGIGGMMQPMMYFEDGFCNYSCTVCSEICPTGALRPLSEEQKKQTQVGRVVFIEDICVVHTEGTNCGACSEHCPTQAVKMVAYKDGLTIPEIDPEICVGCGGCEFICPVRPYRAIYVEGNPVHKKAKAFEEEEKQEIEFDGFGF